MGSNGGSKKGPRPLATEPHWPGGREAKGAWLRIRQTQMALVKMLWFPAQVGPSLGSSCSPYK